MEGGELCFCQGLLERNTESIKLVRELSEGAANIDFEFEIGNFAKGISTAETEKALADSGLFENIAVQVNQELLTAEDEDRIQVYRENASLRCQ